MRKLAIVTVIASMALALATTALAWLNRDTPVPESLYMGSTVDVAAPIGTLVFVATGALIALRQPRHPVAWCFLLMGLLGDLFFTFAHYGIYGTVTAPDALPAAGIAIWIAHWFWPIPATVLPIMLLLFVATDALSASFEAGLVPDGPLGTPILREQLMWASILGVLIYAVTLVGAGASLVVRFRRWRGTERQQLKWFAGAAVVVVALQILSTLAAYVTAPASPVLSALGNLSFALLPLAATVAILRYRLYDIDVVIERTLVYAAVTATLGATYVVAVVVLQGVLRPLTGGSEVAVALSTLLVVALFQPIRRRAQDAVDRRFYRARYDAARTVDAFVVRLRDDVELDSVRADLLDVVNSTIHPAHASVWLRSTR